MQRKSHKRCYECLKLKPVALFHGRRSTKDGLMTVCKKCVSQKQREYYLKRRESLILKSRTYYDSHRKSARDSQRRYYVKNRETLLRSERLKYWINHDRKLEIARKASAKWYAGHKDEALAKQRRYRKAYPEKNSLRITLRRARQKGCAGNVTQEEIQALFAKFSFKCLCCGSTGKLTVDHVVPISEQGSLSIENLQPLCRPCNSRKGATVKDYRISKE